MSHHSAHDSGHLELGHIVPFSVYFKVFISLIVLTAFTVAISRVDFAEFGHPVLNIVVAMLVASVKALLVVLFFMHLKYENPVTWLYAIFPIILLFTLIAGVFTDNPFRSEESGVESKMVVGHTAATH